MEFMLQNKILETMQTLGKADVSKIGFKERVGSIVFDLWIYAINMLLVRFCLSVLFCEII